VNQLASLENPPLDSNTAYIHRDLRNAPLDYWLEIARHDWLTGGLLAQGTITKVSQ